MLSPLTRSRLTHSPLVYGGGVRLVAGDGTPFDASFITSTSSTADLTTYTFSTVSIGAEDASRIVVVGVSYASASTLGISSATIGGISASTLHSGGTSRGCGLVWAEVPTGTTATIVITLAGAAVECGIGVWRIVGAASSTPHDTSNPAGGSDSSRALSLDLPANGAAIAVICDGDSALNTWTLATEAYDAVVSNTNMSGASRIATIAETGTAISCANVRAICGASWGP